MNREQARNMVTYAALQTIVEKTVLSVIPNTNLSKLTPYIVNGVMRRAQTLQKNLSK